MMEAIENVKYARGEMSLDDDDYKKMRGSMRAANDSCACIALFSRTIRVIDGVAQSVQRQ
jgi:hypothetical protein